MKFGRKLSEEHKKKISESRKKYLLIHPDKVPYKLNHKHKETAPEKYFKEVLKGFISQYRPEGTLYEIDFANPGLKIGIEIDGEQHYVDDKIVEHDKIRTENLTKLGWKLIRIRWSYFQSLPFEQRQEIVKGLMEHSFDVEGQIIQYHTMKPKNYCIDCKCQILISSKRCNGCESKKRSNLNKPSNEQLLDNYKTMSNAELSRLYQVSHTTIRRWLLKIK